MKSKLIGHHASMIEEDSISLYFLIETNQTIKIKHKFKTNGDPRTLA